MHHSAKTSYRLVKRASNNYYLYWREDGKPKWKSLRTRSKIEAEKKKKQLLAGIEGEVEGILTVWDGADAWLKDKRRPLHGLDKGTLDNYRVVVARIKEHWGPAALLEDVSTPSVDSFLDFLERKYKLSPPGLKKRLGLLRSFFKWHHERGNMPRNPAVAINLRSVKSQRHPAMEQEEYDRLRVDLAAWIASPVPDHVVRREELVRAQRHSVLDWVDLLWYSGLRSIEALRMQWDDIDFERRIWTILGPHNKGGDRVLPVHQRAVDILKRRKATGLDRPFPMVTRNGWREFKCHFPHWKGTNLHSIRHSFVTRVVLNGHPWAAQMLASHHSTEMTQLYTHAQSDDLREGLDSL